MTTYAELWRRVRLELLLCAEGATTSVDKHVNSGKPGAKPPPRAGEDLRRFDFRWLCVKSDSERRRVILDAMNLLNAMRTPNPPVALRNIPGTVEWRKAVAAEPRPARTVARMFGIKSHTTVLEYRRKYRTDREAA